MQNPTDLIFFASFKEQNLTVIEQYLKYLLGFIRVE